MAYVSSPVPMESILLAMLVEERKSVKGLEERVRHLELEAEGGGGRGQAEAQFAEAQPGPARPKAGPGGAPGN